MLGKACHDRSAPGAGMANGISNFHNAKRAHTPILNVIGEHASWHRPADAPLSMDIEALAGTVSDGSAPAKLLRTLRDSPQKEFLQQ